jgi:hypothetical protein
MAVELEDFEDRALMVELHPAVTGDGTAAWYLQSNHFPRGIKHVQKRALTLAGVGLIWEHMKIPGSALFHWTGDVSVAATSNPFYEVGMMSETRGEYLRWNGSWDDPVPILHAMLQKWVRLTQKVVRELREGDTFQFGGQLCTVIECRRGTKYLTCTYTSDGKHTSTWRSPLEAMVEIHELQPPPANKTRWDRILEEG